jgi:hypothetical protein
MNSVPTLVVVTATYEGDNEWTQSNKTCEEFSH